MKVPFLRCFTLWFTPRVELLPISGHLTPLREEWEDDRPDFLDDARPGAAEHAYTSGWLWRARGWRAAPGWAFLIVFIVVRTRLLRVRGGDAGTAIRARMLSGADCARRAGVRVRRFSFLRRARGEWSHEKSAESVLSRGLRAQQ